MSTSPGGIPPRRPIPLPPRRRLLVPTPALQRRQLLFPGGVLGLLQFRMEGVVDCLAILARTTGGLNSIVVRADPSTAYILPVIWNGAREAYCPRRAALPNRPSAVCSMLPAP